MNVVGRSIKDVQVEVTARQHRWMADEALGAGRDQRSNPYELLLAVWSRFSNFSSCWRVPRATSTSPGCRG